MSRNKGLWAIKGVPVLLYHGIGREPVCVRRNRFSITVDNFKAQLSMLMGYSVFSLPEVAAGVIKPPDRGVVITFDDGLESDFTVAYPLLKTSGLQAHFFVNTANVEAAGYMSWMQINELHKAGMGIGSHGHRHIDLSHISQGLLTSELKRSREILENQLQTPVDSFSVPYGLATDRVVGTAREVGYRTVCTSFCWPAQANRSSISRVAIHRDTSDREFREVVSGGRYIYCKRRVASAAKYFPRQILIRVRPGVLGVNVAQEEG